VILTVSVCSGLAAAATLKRDVAAPSPANRTAYSATPCRFGAGTSSAAQYKASVPAHGLSPSVPDATTVPAESLTSTRPTTGTRPAADFAPTLMILTPVLMPVVKEAGIDPVYFGVLFIMNNAIGLITPPVGIVLNVICGVAKISMKDLMTGLWPFLWAELAVLFLLVLFPSLVMVPLKWLM